MKYVIVVGVLVIGLAAVLSGVEVTLFEDGSMSIIACLPWGICR